MKNLLLTLLAIFAFGAAQAQDCNCEFDPSQPPVCAVDDAGTIAEFPNECWAACYGFTVVEGACDSLFIDPIDPTDSTFVDCGCEFDPNDIPVCAISADGFVAQFPNECLATCFGFTVVEGACDSLYIDPIDPTDSTFVECECEVDPNEPTVCAIDADGFVMEFLNECFANCYGFTVLEGACDSFFIDPIDSTSIECACEFDENEPFICAVDSLGQVCYVPNECVATCLGLTIVEEADCDITDVSGIDEEMLDCINSVDAANIELFQAFLLALNEAGCIELDECTLGAPLFDNDEDFINYIVENCITEVGGDSINGGGNPSGLVFYNSYLNNSTTSATQQPVAKTAVSILQNPVTDVLTYTISAPKAGDITAKIVSLNGQTMTQQKNTVAAGQNRFTLEVNGLPNGMYLLQISDAQGTQTQKFILSK